MMSTIQSFASAQTRRFNRSLLAVIGLLIFGVALQTTTDAASPAPPAEVTVKDVPNDDGTRLELKWLLSADDAPGSAAPVARYEVTRYGVREHLPITEIIRLILRGRFPNSAQHDETKTSIEVPAGTDHVVSSGCDSSYDYEFTVEAFGQDGTRSEPVRSRAMRPIVNWFDKTKTSFAMIVLAVCATVIICTEIARRGKPFYVRPIAGLLAIEEAVGRATEMGKPLLFVPGIEDVREIDTVAGLMVLSSVARTAAEYDTPLEVPTSRTLVMTAAREAVQAAALVTGHPDYYNEERIHYVTEEQFGYVASVCGWMQREKPAACFFLGKFFAESLILAETGNAVGAIQIAGTAETTQLPFFVAACDYTLLGEELFAASAYLSGEPAQLGMLKGQDFGKLGAIILIVVGCALASWDSVAPPGKTPEGTPKPGRASILVNGILNK
jgi:hypothetical protein